MLNADDRTCVELATRTRAQVYWFSRTAEVKQGAFVRAGRIVFRDHTGQREIMLVSEISLKGAHNLENVLAAVCVGALLGCEPDRIRTGRFRNFKAVEHRLEHVATIDGVDYYNDSKATNVDATIKAIESFPANIHLILGGKDKDSDYTVLNDLIRKRVKRVYTIGAAAAKIESQIVSSEEWRPRTRSRRNSGSCDQTCRRSCHTRGYRLARSRLCQLRPVPQLRASRQAVQASGK